jgi:hypothetical protein
MCHRTGDSLPRIKVILLTLLLGTLLGSLLEKKSLIDSDNSAHLEVVWV